MNAPVIKIAQPISDSQVLEASKDAGRRIAPTWPLDQLIAVNPWWEMRAEPIAEVAAKISTLGHANGHMPRAWFKQQFPEAISREALQTAAAETPCGFDAEHLIAWLSGEDKLPHWRNYSDQIDAQRDLVRNVSWHDEIVHQISQFCASFYSSGTPLPSEQNRCLYQTWLDSVRQDRGIEILMGAKGLHKQFAGLPDSAELLLRAAVDELSIPSSVVTDYFHALLLDINGWASWIAYLRWQDQLSGVDMDALPQLVAVRLAWELALWRFQPTVNAANAETNARLWLRQFDHLDEMIDQHQRSQQPAWIWQRAAELSYQNKLHQKLLSSPSAEPEMETGTEARPNLQITMCIDVRSEVFRRALEAQNPGIQTFGFAGFFGLPIAYSPAGASYKRPQMPGLLSPEITVTDEGEPDEVARHSGQLRRRARWSSVSRAAPATFGYVESVGLGYAFKLLRESLFGRRANHPVNDAPFCGTQYALQGAEGDIDFNIQAEMAAGILSAMTLTSNFAPVVIFAGHGSNTRNNPHAAGLDCGACCGQTGEVNVRVLAQILNTEEVRKTLAESYDIVIPEDTQFVAGLHDTTTDDFHFLADLPEGQSKIGEWLEDAGRTTRRERATRLGIAAENADAEVRARSRNWAVVRPEWGLAANACFIVAPRKRTKHIDLGGRSFLHDYDWHADAKLGYTVLEQIMTAPMLVTHWINMQYNLSVIDNERYGSGNKVLHNVVGGNLGVFEGNGGDLRIGLPMQSIHNGKQWMHETLRLSVYIAAPAEAIADIAHRHDVVRQLIDNEWLYLFRLDDDRGSIERLKEGAWHTEV